MKNLRRMWMSVLFIVLFLQGNMLFSQTIVVGGKPFTEGYVTLEIIATLLEHHGFTVVRKRGLGGTSVTFRALESGEIDVYTEYSGTIEQVILKSRKRLTYPEIQKNMSNRGFHFLNSFGFNNTYAIGVSETLAKKLNLRAIEDLQHKRLRAVFNREFLKRNDGWPSLSQAYQLTGLQVTGIEHSLAYEAIKHGNADVTDVYSTDAKIKKFNLRVLEDNRNFFPIYKAAPLARKGLSKKVYRVLAKLENQISADEMIHLNDLAEHHGKSFSEIASQFLLRKKLIQKQKQENATIGEMRKILRLTGEHLYLTCMAIFLAVGFAIPLGVFIYMTGMLSKTVMMIAGLLQTIPSIALLMFMIPLFGIGVKPAIVALFLYSILPILRNTYSALHSIDPDMKDSARGIGLYRYETLLFVELPLAFPLIVAGIRTAAVISIGTATLAAFIGAGGLGEPIVTGLALNDTSIILQGAIPAALLAMLVELVLERVEHRLKLRFSMKA